MLRRLGALRLPKTVLVYIKEPTCTSRSPRVHQGAHEEFELPVRGERTYGAHAPVSVHTLAPRLGVGDAYLAPEVTMLRTIVRSRRE